MFFIFSFVLNTQRRKRTGREQQCETWVRGGKGSEVSSKLPQVIIVGSYKHIHCGSFSSANSDSENRFIPLGI